MSTLTKVLIVVFVVLAILCSVVFIQAANTTINYRDAYNDQVRKALEARAAADLAIAQKNALQTDMTTTLASRDEAIKQRDSRITDLQSQLATAKLDLGSATNRGALLDTTVAGLKDTLQTQQKINTTLDQQLGQERKLNVQLMDQSQDLQQALAERSLNLNNAMEAVKMLRDQLADRDRTIEDLRQARATGAAPGQTATTVSPATPIKGEIKLLDDGLAMINVGSADGVTEGMRFTIYRTTADKAEFIGYLSVSTVYPDRAAGVLSELQKAPQVGDKATTKL